MGTPPRPGGRACLPHPRSISSAGPGPVGGDAGVRRERRHRAELSSKQSLLEKNP